MKFYSLYSNPKQDYKKQDLSRKTEKVFKEIKPFALDKDTGQILNKHNYSINKCVGEVNIYDRIQSFKEDCDIYSILNRFANGDTSALSQKIGSFGDYADIPDNIHDFSKYISELSAKFDKLSPELKEAIQGDNLSKIQELIHKEVADILAKQNNAAVEKKEEVK